MRLIRTLADADRRLPFGTATLVGATVLGLLVSGTVATRVKGTPTASVEQAAPSPAPSATKSAQGKPKPTASPKPVKPIDFLLDVDEAVPGWSQIADSIAGGGEMDLEAAAEIEAGGDTVTEKDRAALRELGFVRGHARAWRHRKDDVTLVVFVYEWKSKDGPLTFVEGMKAINQGKGGWVPRTPRSYGVCKLQEPQTYDGIITAVGKHSFLVVTLREGSCETHEPVARIADLVQKHATRLRA